MKNTKFTNFLLAGTVMLSSVACNRFRPKVEECSCHNSVAESFKDENGNLDGEYKAYYDDGSLYITGQVVNEKKEGEWLTYRKNGQVNVIEHYQNGKLDGECKEYYDDGSLYIIGQYVNGKGEGEWLLYHRNGQVNVIEHYKNGVLNGEYTEYRYDDSLYITGQVVNEKKEGEWLTHHKDGGMEYRKYFNGELHGKSYNTKPLNGKDVVTDEKYYLYGNEVSAGEYKDATVIQQNLKTSSKKTGINVLKM